ncbi:Hypothetical predicted protein [Marmota monax]|uniref:DH domain-containing protein n=1 Tax=Marmota monax TaxID=9995 RepID=A0A5E4AD10_MARMO|nr:Hypothetical predicted protein [Marmota monax]
MLKPPCWEKRGTAAREKDVWKYWATSCFLHLSPLNPSNLHVFGSQMGVAHGDLAEFAFAQPLGDCHRQGPIKSLQEVFAPQAATGRDLVLKSGLPPGPPAFPILPGSSRASLLYKPIDRVTRSTLVLHDLLKHTPVDHPDYPLLQDALRISQNFLSSINEDIDPRRTAVTTPKGEVHVCWGDHTTRGTSQSLVFDSSKSSRTCRPSDLDPYSAVDLCDRSTKDSGRSDDSTRDTHGSNRVVERTPGKNYLSIGLLPFVTLLNFPATGSTQS